MSGMYGTVTEIEDGGTVLIEISEDTEVRIAAGSIAQVITAGGVGTTTESTTASENQPHMSLRQRSLMFVLVVVGLLAGSVAVIALKPTVLGLDLKGGAQVILQASPTANAEVNDASMRRAINVIRNRVDAFGVSEPEIQKQGTSQISGRPPGGRGPRGHPRPRQTRPAQLLCVPAEPRRLSTYPAPASTVNPPAGTTDLYGLIQLAKRTEAKPDAQKSESVYLFRRNAAHTFVAGPSQSIAELVKRLEAAPETQAVAAEYKAKKKAFDVQVLPRGFVILTNGEGAGSDLKDLPLCGNGGRCILLHDVVGVAGSEVKSANLGFDAGQQPDRADAVHGHGTPEVRGDHQANRRRRDRRGAPCASANDSSCFWNFAISLDGVMISNPYVSYKDNPGGINSDSAEISGGFTESGARTLADQLSSGAIPIKLDAVSTSTVSATLWRAVAPPGAHRRHRRPDHRDARADRLLPGARCDRERLAEHLRALLLGAREAHPDRAHPPGIAGLILTIGVAADASVVIFERVREESRAGRAPRSAILNGYKRGITAIIDANIVTPRHRRLHLSCSRPPGRAGSRSPSSWASCSRSSRPSSRPRARLASWSAPSCSRTNGSWASTSARSSGRWTSSAVEAVARHLVHSRC